MVPFGHTMNFDLLRNLVEKERNQEMIYGDYEVNYPIVERSKCNQQKKIIIIYVPFFSRKNKKF